MTMKRRSIQDHSFASTRVVGPGRQFGNFNGGSGDETYNGGGGDDVAYGNGGNDTLNGNNGNDRLYGGSGHNTLNGGAGNDVLYTSDGGIDTVDGGTGNDRWIADYSAATAAIAFNNSTGTLSNGASITGIESYSITTGSGNDSFMLSTTLTGNSSIIDAGGGSDSLTYDLSAYSESVEFDVRSYEGAFDIVAYAVSYNEVYHVETVRLIGTGNDDTFVVDASPLTSGNTLDLDGGLGSDSLRINFSDLTGVTLIDNGDGTTTSNAGTYSNFETYSVTTGSGTNIVAGGALADQLSGGSTAQTGGADTFFGKAGADTLTGSFGNDVLDGGAGNDTLSGGVGIDTAAYVDALSGVTVTIKNAQQNTVGAGLDTLSGIENLTGSDHNDTLTGDANANVIEGGAGNDMLNGAAGIDTASYATAAAGVSVDLSLATA